MGVDEYFPEYKCVAYEQRSILGIAYNEPVIQKFWSELVEKACAVLCANYPNSYGTEDRNITKALDGGHEDEACSMLTGMPSMRFGLVHNAQQTQQHFDFEEPFAFLQRYFKRGYLLTASSHTEGEQQHAFTIVRMGEANRTGAKWAREWAVRNDGVANGQKYIDWFDPNNIPGPEGIRPSIFGDPVPGEPGVYRLTYPEMNITCQSIFIGCFDTWTLSAHSIKAGSVQNARLRVRTEADAKPQIRIGMFRRNKRGETQECDMCRGNGLQDSLEEGEYHKACPKCKGTCNVRRPYAPWGMEFDRKPYNAVDGMETGFSAYMFSRNTEAPLNGIERQSVNPNQYVITPFSVASEPAEEIGYVRLLRIPGPLREDARVIVYEREEFSAGDIVSAHPIHNDDPSGWTRAYEGLVKERTATGYIVEFSGIVYYRELARKELSLVHRRPDADGRPNVTVQPEDLVVYRYEEQAPVEREAPRPEWKCQVCTFRNPGIAPACELCAVGQRD